MAKEQDKIRGSLIGGAIGDALGYPVEFLTYPDIVRKYGERGITRLDCTQWWSQKESEKALISDDTQMTLFTACGVLNAKRKELCLDAICQAYIEWYYTQCWEKPDKKSECWIADLEEMNTRRAPGNTCLSSLEAIIDGRNPLNDSKGCGGVMRTAPVALYGAIDNRMSIDECVVLAGQAARLTHKHPLGWLPSALEAYIIYRLIQNDAPTIENFKEYITKGIEKVFDLYPDCEEDIKVLKSLIGKATELVNAPTPDCQNIEAIGGGWTGEETLAIAIYCSLKYFDDFEKALIASVNHSGDSDSTGAVTGNILGTIVGYEAIPQGFKDDVELHDVIIKVADELLKNSNVQTQKKVRWF